MRLPTLTFPSARSTAAVKTPVDLVPAPAVLEVTPNYVRVGDGYAATYAVCGYPAEVGPAWLVPLLSYPGRVTVAVHTTPIPAQVAAPMLTKQRARLESTRRIDAERGKLGDPMVEAAASDAADLAERVARGASKLHHGAVYVTVHGRSLDEMHATAAGVRSAAASMLLDLQPATFRHHLGYTTTLPLGVDALGMRRIFDTESLAAAFPFASGDLAAPAPGRYANAEAVLYGVNTTTHGVLLWNRWAQDNHNSVILARSGAGKSYFVKSEILRSLYQGVEVGVIDPEDEYAPLAEHVGGTVIQLGKPGVCLNPLDLPVGSDPRTLHNHELTVHTIITVMLGVIPPPGEKQALDRAITATYEAAGITNDPATWSRPAPLLRDLATTLTADPDPAAQQMAARLAPWTHGSYCDLFAGPTTARPEGHLVIWSLRHLPDELRTIGTMLALNHIWGRIDEPTQESGAVRGLVRRRLVVVDEAWLLMRDGEGARFLARMSKAARKRNAGLTVVTQDASDVLSTNLGLTVVSNAATQILMRQSTQAIDAVTEAFGLTGGEARLLLSAGRGEGLLVAGRSRVPFRSRASGSEHVLASTGIGGEQ
jgi:type IV secretory pathway VirB4 component